MSLLRASHRRADNRVRSCRFVRLHDVKRHMRHGWRPMGLFIGSNYADRSELMEAPTWGERIAAWAKRSGGAR